MANSTSDRVWTAALELYELRREGEIATPDLIRRTQQELASIGSAPIWPPSSLRHYDSDTYGPFLGISNEGYGASLICDAALRCPKARALGTTRNPLNVGVGVDGEVLGGIGEVPVGPEEYAQIWAACIEQTLMTTNVGARANPRIFRAAPFVTVDLDSAGSSAAAMAELSRIFMPYSNAPGGARPLLVYVDFTGERHAQTSDLAALREHVETAIARIPSQRLGLRVVLDGSALDETQVLSTINLAAAADVRNVAVDGLARRAAERVISLPGLLNYFDRDAVQRILAHAKEAEVTICPYNQLDADTVARQIWSTLNTARGFGLHLGKYGLVPLTLEQSDRVVGQIQRWLGDWSAAPVCYVDRDLLSDERVYSGNTLVEGIAEWLEMVARHKVPLVLIDTIDKAEGRKILRSGGDPKGLLNIEEIARLDAHGRALGIKVMWAGGITSEQAAQFGELGVFGLYITSAISDRVPASGIYLDDPAIDAAKHPNVDKIIAVKTLIEAGFLKQRLLDLQSQAAETWRQALLDAGQDTAKLGELLPEVWQFWWSLKPASNLPG
jgi:hypothetical protein